MLGPGSELPACGSTTRLVPSARYQISTSLFEMTSGASQETWLTSTVGSAARTMSLNLSNSCGLTVSEFEQSERTTMVSALERAGRLLFWKRNLPFDSNHPADLARRL